MKNLAIIVISGIVLTACANQGYQMPEPKENGTADSSSTTASVTIIDPQNTMNSRTTTSNINSNSASNADIDDISTDPLPEEAYVVPPQGTSYDISSLESCLQLPTEKMIAVCQRDFQAQ